MSIVTVHHGDSREVLKGLPDHSIDSVVCDPPYALVSIVKRFGKAGAAPAKGNEAYARASAGFMGKTWDTGETAFAVEFWQEVMRVLKPGGHVIAASGTRTYHRLAVAIEDAGFEIRDMISWLYGSGFPKSHDVVKGIDARLLAGSGRTEDIRRLSMGDEYEPSGRGRVNFDHGGGSAMNGATTKGAPKTPEAAEWQGWGTALKPACEPWVLARKPLVGTVAANVMAHGTGAINIDGCRVGTGEDVVTFERHAGTRDREQYRTGTVGAVSPSGRGRFPANVIHDGSAEVVEAFPLAPGQLAAVGPQHGPKASVNVYGDYGPRDQFNPRGDEGSAARFFYSAKADAEDRLGSKHPTVKPIDLMAYLCRLVTPPGGTVLDPFAGTGTTGVACMREGFDCILVEREDEYVADIKRRLAWARGEGRMTNLEMAKLDTPKAKAAAVGADLPLFADDAA